MIQPLYGYKFLRFIPGYSISVDSWEGGGGSSKILLTSKKDNKFNLFFFLNLEFRILLQYSTHEYNNYGVSYNIFQETLNPSDSKGHDYVFLSKSNSLLKKGNLRHGDIVSIK